MVRFNPRARLDRSRVRDVGGGGGGGAGGPGMRLPIPGGVAGRGGIGGVILLVVLFVVAQCAGVDLGSILGSGTSLSTARLGDAADTGRYDDCETGEDANQDQDCARVAVENSLTDFWESQDLPDWRPEEALITFSGSVSTACGGATSAVGPFYCPADETIYYDTTFYDQVLEDQLGGPDGGFVEFYVLAHEYGHHISNIIGSMGEVTTQETGPQSPGVRLELQADCFAGMWARHADGTDDAGGEPLLAEPIPESDVELAIEAAEAVGDDRIQRKTQGQVTPETWTHGSAEQRKKWFLTGYDEGSLEACDTFEADRV